MATVRYLVKDVDAAISFYAALGFELADRWGPPFAVMKLGDLTLWVSGPGTSAAKALPDGSEPRPGGWNRFVIEVPDLDTALAWAARSPSAQSAGVEVRPVLVMKGER